ncbi:MAG TPA: hypothetical protein VE996_01860 [Terriglobales bacterium]|nr:hypothetical protein [Terriglobales bacterium]
MSTVRNIDRRTFVRRQTDQMASESAPGLAAAPDRSIQWNGVWTGYLIWAGCEAILLALVLGLGMGDRDPLQAASWGAAGKATIVWAIIITWIATFIGCWMAARTPNSRNGRSKALTLWGLIELTLLVAIGAIGLTSVRAPGALGTHSVAANFFWLSLIALGCAIGGGIVGSRGAKETRSSKPVQPMKAA